MRLQTFRELTNIQRTYKYTERAHKYTESQGWEFALSLFLDFRSLKKSDGERFDLVDI